MSTTADTLVYAVRDALEALRRPIPDGVTAVTVAGAVVHRDHISADTPTGVAAHLLAGGYRGDPYESDHCPVAEYLTATVTPRPYDILVCPTAVRVAVTEQDYRHVPLPSTVTRFVCQFDAGYYPELVAPGAAGDLTGMLT